MTRAVSVDTWLVERRCGGGCCCFRRRARRVKLCGAFVFIGAFLARFALSPMYPADMLRFLLRRVSFGRCWLLDSAATRGTRRRLDVPALHRGEGQSGPCCMGVRVGGGLAGVSDTIGHGVIRFHVMRCIKALCIAGPHGRCDDRAWKQDGRPLDPPEAPEAQGRLPQQKWQILCEDVASVERLLGSLHKVITPALPRTICVRLSQIAFSSAQSYPQGLITVAVTPHGREASNCMIHLPYLCPPL